MRFLIFGHASNKFNNSRPLVTARLGSLGWNGILDQLHFRFQRPNTFSAVHHGLDLACRNEGLEVLWTENLSEIRKSDIVFAEAKYIKVLGDLSRYHKVILHAEPSAFEYIVTSFPNVYFWENYKGNFSKSDWEQVGPLSFFKNSSRSIQMPWGSDVFDVKKENIKVKKNTSYYVGNFSTDALDKAKKLKTPLFEFLRVGGVSFEQARYFVKMSEFTFDVRNDHCIQYGFIPCRIFKNFSYGKICFTNSPHISEIFSIPLYQNLDDLLGCLESLRSGKLDECVRDLQHTMLTHHTYLNRLKILKKIIGF